MYICRLFHRDRPFEQIEARALAEGSITLGRDPSADWPLGEGDSGLSRTHCVLAVEDGRLTLSDRSTNGTFLDNGERAPRDVPIPLQVRESFRLGDLTILIDRPELEASSDTALTALHLPLSQVPAEVPSDWSEREPARPAHRDASLIEAFCEGAKLDASALSAEDPVELMRRVGAIYQQTVLGLATLMAERTRIKAEFQLDRTVITAADNNPFKWAPTRRLAQDLLCARNLGFLSDADAVRASFEDLSRHLAAVASGANAVADYALHTLSPEAIAAEASTHGFSLRGQAATCWDILNQRHTALSRPKDGKEPATRRVFAEAYGQAIEASAG